MVFTMPLVKKNEIGGNAYHDKTTKKQFVRMFLKICLENITVQIVETATKTCLKIKLKFNNPSVRAVIFQGWVKKS